MKEREKAASTSYTYRALRGVFTISLKGFYNTVEVNNAAAVPRPGECTILCPNHGNSLTDAIAVVSQCPRMVRLTAKDNLWKDPIFGWWVRNVGTVPIQRKSDHGGKADNAAAMKNLYDALQAGDCVCLFPEGISRYQSGLAPLKLGVGRIALEVLKRQHEKGNGDFVAKVVTCALTYLHREKFRSDLGVAFACASTLKASDYPRLVKEGGGEFGAAENIMKAVAAQLREDMVTAPDWECLVAAHAARCMHAPLGTRISLHQTVALTQKWVRVLSATTEEERQRRSLTRRASEPSLDLLRDRDATEAECAKVGLLRDALLEYEDRRSALGLSDIRIRRPLSSAFVLVGGVVARAAWSSVLLVLAAPGTVILSPLFVLGKGLEIWLRRKYKGMHQVRNMDEVTQYKLAIAYCVVPAVVAAGVGTLMKGLGLPTAASCLVAPAWLWMTVRWLEDGVACANACVELSTLFLRKRQVMALRQEREGLEARVAQMAKEHGMPTTDKLLENAPPHIQNRRFWHYFSPKRRRKVEWGEVVHFGHKGYDYPVSVFEGQKTKRYFILPRPIRSPKLKDNAVYSAT